MARIWKPYQRGPQRSIIFLRRAIKVMVMLACAIRRQAFEGFARNVADDVENDLGDMAAWLRDAGRVRRLRINFLHSFTLAPPDTDRRSDQPSGHWAAPAPNQAAPDLGHRDSLPVSCKAPDIRAICRDSTLPLGLDRREL